MQCKICGHTLADNATVCDACNTPVAENNTKERVIKKRNGCAVASAVLGLIGIPAFAAVIFNLLAIFLGAISIRSDKANYAKAGILLGIVGCIVSIILYSVLLSDANLKAVTDFIYYSFA